MHIWCLIFGLVGSFANNGRLRKGVGGLICQIRTSHIHISQVFRESVSTKCSIFWPQNVCVCVYQVLPRNKGKTPIPSSQFKQTFCKIEIVRAEVKRIFSKILMICHLGPKIFRSLLREAKVLKIFTVLLPWFKQPWKCSF